MAWPGSEYTDLAPPRPLSDPEWAIIYGHYPYQWDADGNMTPITLAPGIVFECHIEWDGDADEFGRMIDCSYAVGEINGVEIDTDDLKDCELYGGFREARPWGP